MGWGGGQLGNLCRESRGLSASKGRKGDRKGSWLSPPSSVVWEVHCTRQWHSHEHSNQWCRGQLSPVAVFIKRCRTGFDHLFFFCLKGLYRFFPAGPISFGVQSQKGINQTSSECQRPNRAHCLFPSTEVLRSWPKFKDIFSLKEFTARQHSVDLWCH